MVHPALAPFSIAGLTLRNRLVVAPMSRVSTAGDGLATEAMQHYYAAFAEGGFGLVVTEGTYTDLAHSQAYGRQPGIASEAQAAAWGPVVRAVHERGAAIVLQLMHAGALVQENAYREQSIAPSAITPAGAKMPDYGGCGAYADPRAATPDDLRLVVAGFAGAARRAQEAGFDGVEVHAANGYLLDQFLTVPTNVRTDAYGGAVENRVRIVAEVLRAIGGAVSSDLVVGVRLSQTKVNDTRYRWPGGAVEAAAIFQAVHEAGAHYIHVASEGGAWDETATLSNGESITALARRVTGLPVIANGGLGDAEQAARILEGPPVHADAVALGRSALANPDWPARLASGRSVERFDPGMIHPFASLANSDAWRRQ